jgi:hypothetical protein
LLKAYTKWIIRLDDFGKERSRIENDTLQIENKLKEINKERDQGNTLKKAKERLKSLAKDFKKAFKTGSFINQKELIHSLLESVIVDKNGKIKINYRLG